MKILEYIFAIILIGTILLLFVPLCLYGLIMAVVDKIRRKQKEDNLTLTKQDAIRE